MAQVTTCHPPRGYRLADSPHAKKGSSTLNTQTDQPPRAGNAAWQRFWKLVEEHFETVCWNDDDGRPTLLTLIDLPSGEALTLSPLDAMDTDPAAVLLVSAADCRLSARGPLAGSAAANDLTLRLAQADDDPPTGATCPVLLHPPDQPRLPPQAWIEMPEPIAAHVWAPPAGGAGPVLLVLLDRAAAQMKVIGTLATVSEAESWQPQPPLDPRVERLVVALT
jgi:hypothetical protein